MSYTNALGDVGTVAGVPLGQEVTLASQDSARTLFYLNADGTVYSTDAGFSQIDLPSTAIPVTIPAGAGPVKLVRVQNDSAGTLQRGTVVKRKLDAENWQVTTCGANEAAAAVLLSDVPDGAYAWAVREGWAPALVTSGGLGKGVLLKPAASGETTTGVAGTDLIIGITAAAIAGTLGGIFFRPVA